MADKRQLIRDWFDIPRPKFPVLLLIIGIGLIIAAFAVMNNHNFRKDDDNAIGGIMIFIGVIIIVISLVSYFNALKRYRGRPSVEQMQKWLSEDLEVIKVASLSKLDLDISEMRTESMLIEGPLFWSEPGFNFHEAIKRRHINDEDDNSPYLYACWQIMVLHFPSHVMSIYQCNYNWYRNGKVNERTKEFGYEDMVLVTTEIQASAHTIFNGQLQSSLTFCMSLTSGDKIGLILKDPQLKAINEEEATTMGERAVTIIRKFKRDRKSASGV
jgi:hypothetical protein